LSQTVVALPCSCVILNGAERERAAACFALSYFTNGAGRGVLSGNYYCPWFSCACGVNSPSIDIFINSRRSRPFTVFCLLFVALLRSLAVAPPFAACGGSVGLPLIQEGQ